jgi:Fe-S cluster assembly protein SufD
MNLSALLRASGESDDALARRETAREHLASYSMPTGREEVWRYVDLGFALGDYELAPPPDGDPPQGDDEAANSSARAQIVDGAVVAAAARVDGLRCARVAGGEESIVPADADIFTAAHDAFGAEWVEIAVDRGTAIERTVVVDVSARSSAASFPGVRIDVADGAELTIAIRLDSADDVAALVVPHIEGRVGANANLTVVVDQEWGRQTRAIGQLVFSVGRDSSIQLAEAGLGGTLARWQLNIKLAGQGSNAQVIGAYFGDRDQTLDYRYVMHHAAPNTHSTMFLKGAVEDEAGSIFTGMIRIDEEAQRTDAFQTNRNLILSDGASSQSVPNLEILANDVKCGHASTVGQLDPEQRYYLMSRGLDPMRADRLQVRGFFQEALNRFPVPEMVEPLRERFYQKYLDAQAGGRV